MYTELTASNFYSEWKRLFLQQEGAIISSWNLKKTYTRKIYEIIQSIAAQYKMEINTEYYSTDAILFYKDDVFVNGSDRYIINPAVVFEHENDANSFLSEIAHNLMIVSKLHVVVSYYNEVIDEDVMSKSVSIINMHHNAHEISDNESFLLILGNALDYNSSEYWKGFVYNNGNWKMLD